MRTVFVEPAHEQALRRDGFVRIPFLTPEAIESFRELVEGLDPDDGFAPTGQAPTNPRTYHCTFLDVSDEYKREFDRLIREHMTEAVESLLVGYGLLVANCYAKQPGMGEFEAHMNWHLTAHPADITLTFWVPLQSCGEQNGTLNVVPGSHKITPWIAHPRGDHYFSEYSQRIIDRYYQPVDVALGEAVVFDDSLIHGSGPNQSDQVRFALQIEAIPLESVPIVHYPRADGAFDLLDGSEQLYLTSTLADIGAWPETFAHFGVVDSPNEYLDISEFDRALTNGPDYRARLWSWGPRVMRRTRRLRRWNPPHQPIAGPPRSGS